MIQDSHDLLISSVSFSFLHFSAIFLIGSVLNLESTKEKNRKEDDKKKWL